MLNLSFTTEIIHWRGPSPFYFAPVPPADSARIAAIAKSVTYGWGVIPVEATIGRVTFTTSLIPRDGLYLLPLKLAVRNQLHLPEDAPLSVAMTIGNGDR